MGYKSLRECVSDLDKHGQLLRIKDEVDPYLEMAAVQLEAYRKGGPAIYFERVKGSAFPALSNLFGTPERCNFIFRDTIEDIKKLIALKSDPIAVLKAPWSNRRIPLLAFKALPSKAFFSRPVEFSECNISDLPQIQHWPMDGGAFITLPAVYTEDIEKPGIMHSNLGMYRIQLSGNEYVRDKEIGLHYQLHRGIGIHQAKSNEKGVPLKVSIFIGGPPAHILSAVMPLPEGIPELTFAGALNNRRFRYFYDKQGFCLSADADFVITGEVYPNENKPEGPFGDHLGYYSLKHPFPLMRVKKVYHRRDAIWPFTVVGRPPQEDTGFGNLIHELTGGAIKEELPGVHDVHAVDAAGVHPLLLAIGSERYTPYLKDERRPSELLTIANRILGTGQLSLAKWLFIAAKEDNPSLNVHAEEAFFSHILERIDLTRDLHFHTKTSIDTLDYSGDGLNTGSKLVLAAAGLKCRELRRTWDSNFSFPAGYENPKIAMPGVLALKAPSFTSYEEVKKQVNELEKHISPEWHQGFPLIVLCDDSDFTSKELKNFLWVTFTRSNPSHDVHGVHSFHENKHWGCRGPLIIDARIKPHHAPPLIEDNNASENAKKILAQAGLAI